MSPVSRPAVFRDVERDRIHAVVPAALRDALPAKSLLPERATVVVFASDSRDVVTLRQARKVLAEVGGGPGVVTVMVGATEEADAAFRAAGAIVARRGGFFWTEGTRKRQRS
jgi:hypothetical protein